MSKKPISPVVGIPVNHSTADRPTAPLFTTSKKYAEVVANFSNTTPILIPAFGAKTNFEVILGQINGLLLTGGRANVEPHHYQGSPFPDDEIIDPERDETVLPLVRGCVDRGIPVFGICRGIQEINVAMGGSLHYRIHLLPGKNDHRMRRDTDLIEEKFGLRHSIKLSPDGLLKELSKNDEVMVNSLHGQGIDRIADSFTVEAISPDGVIEAISMQGSESFTVGVQWHAEWAVERHDLSRKLFETFGLAALKHAKRTVKI